MNAPTNTSTNWQLFVKSTSLMLILALAVNLVYYLVFDLLIEVPIPAPYGLTSVFTHTTILILVNGYIHFKQRHNRKKNTFGYVSTLLMLLITNLVLCAFVYDIRMMPSINEMNRLYGEQRVPDILLLLSVPLAIIPSLFGIFGIPALIYRKLTQENNLVQTYRSKAYLFVKVYLILSSVLILVNIIYYSIYVRLGENMPLGGYTFWEMVQMTLVSTGLAVLLYLYITDSGKQGLTLYIILTICFTISGFLAGLPHPDGQPVYDESLWFSVPLTIFSLIVEMFGIPLAFKFLQKFNR